MIDLTQHKLESTGDILDRLRRRVPDLKDAEKRVARQFLSDPDWAARSSISAVAARAGVSEPTVMRLCRRLGLDGFKALKHRLTEDLVLARMFREARSVPERAQPSTLVATLLDTAMRAVSGATEMLDLDRLNSAAKAVIGARMIYCLGVGGSSAVLAEELENRLFRLGLSAQAVADPYRQRMTAAIADPSDLFIAISSTGVPSSINDAIARAHSLGAATLTLTQPGSPLAERSGILLPVEIFDDETFFLLPTRTRYAQLFTIDCLMGTVAAQMPDAEAKLNAIRQMLLDHHGPIRSQPIGD